MASSFIQLVSDSANTGKMVDTNLLTVSANNVHRQNMCLADPATAAAIANVTQFHSSDNQALGTFYGLAVGGISQILNVNGNLDRARGFQGDQVLGTGLPLDVSMTTQLCAPTLSTSSPGAGSNVTFLIPSTTNIKVGSIVQIENLNSSVVEWCRVNTVTSNTSIVVDKTANAHTTPPVYPILFNAPRDAQGAGPLAYGPGLAVAAGYVTDGLWNHPERGAFGLGLYSDTSATNATAGTNVVLTVAGTPPTLGVDQTLPLLIIDGAASTQELCTVVATNPGGKTVTVGWLQNNHNGSVTALVLRAPIQQLNAAPASFGGFGLPAEAATLFSGLEGTNNNMLFSVAKDVVAAGSAPTQSSAGQGMAAEVAYAWYQTTTPNLTNGKLTPLLTDGQGALLTTLPTQSNWSLTNTSAANGQATASKSAGAANVRHVCTSFSGQIWGDATGNADQGTLNLRDGATGAGTVLAQGRCSLATGANAVGTQFAMTGFWVGTAATAMTIEFSAAGATHTIQSVSATGYDTRTA